LGRRLRVLFRSHEAYFPLGGGEIGLSDTPKRVAR